MKKLSIKEKAKAYDEVLERAKEKYSIFEGMKQGDVLEDVFPELKESEDERIEEWLINLVKGHIEWLEDRIREQLSNGQVYGGELVKAKNSLAWLEKQDEKPTDEEMKEALHTEYEKGRADAIAKMQQLDALHDAAVYVDKSMFPYPKGTLKLREG